LDHCSLHSEQLLHRWDHQSLAIHNEGHLRDKPYLSILHTSLLRDPCWQADQLEEEPLHTIEKDSLNVQNQY
jgi:hypothetical protein